MIEIPVDKSKKWAWRSQRWRIFDAAINWEHIKTVLNVGASRRDFFLRNILDKHKCIITVLEAFQPYVHVLEIDPALEVHQGNLLDYNFGDRQWDMVVWWGGPEHLLKRSDLDVALANLEPLASKLVVLGMPWGRYPQPRALNGNQLQVHRQSWLAKDFSPRGYGCILTGPRSVPPTNHLMAVKVIPGSGYIGVKGQWWKKVSG